MNAFAIGAAAAVALAALSALLFQATAVTVAERSSPEASVRLSEEDSSAERLEARREAVARAE